ncbi:MAG: ATP-binding cassette domain-containing protein [Enterocloster sp.]
MEQIVNNMVGQEISAYYPDKSSGIDGELMRVENLRMTNKSIPISVDLRKKEILGFYGLIGAGRSEMLRAMCGIDPRFSGDVWLEGQKTTIRSYQDALKYGISYLTEDRRKQVFSQVYLSVKISMFRICVNKEVFG